VSRAAAQAFEGGPSEPAGRPQEPVGDGRPRWMVAERSAVRRPGTGSGLQADSSAPSRGLLDSGWSGGHDPPLRVCRAVIAGGGCTWSSPRPPSPEAGNHDRPSSSVARVRRHSGLSDRQCGGAWPASRSAEVDHWQAAAFPARRGGEAQASRRSAGARAWTDQITPSRAGTRRAGRRHRARLAVRAVGGSRRRRLWGGRPAGGGRRARRRRRP
jgi:hypothetical protein